MEPHQTSSPLADGDAEQREAEYARIEQQIAAAGAPGDQESAVALVVASVKPLIEHVLCAAASRVPTEEWTRASVLLYEMIKVDMLKVCAEFNRKTEEGIPLVLKAGHISLAKVRADAGKARGPSEAQNRRPYAV